MFLFSIQAQFSVLFVKIELHDKETSSARPPASVKDAPPVGSFATS